MRPELRVIAGLAGVQAAAELVLSAQWIRAGEANLERGVIFLPMMGVILMTWGGFAAGLAVLYALFAWAALTGRSWAWSIGLFAVLLNGFAIGVLSMAGETPLRLALRAIVPVVVLCYLFTPAGKRALRPSQALRTKPS